MDIIAVVLVLISAFLHAWKSLYIKQALDKEVFLLSYLICGMFLYFPVFLWFLFHNVPSVDVLLRYGLLSALIHFLYIVFVAKAYECGDLSLVYPIMRSSPALVLICAILFLGETVTWQAVAGIVLVAIGVYTISMDKFNLRQLLLPLTTLVSRPATRYALLTMLTVTAYSIVDKKGVQYIHPFVFLYVFVSFSGILLGVYVLRVKPVAAFQREWRENRSAILINGIIAQGGYLLILIAFTFERVSYVAAFRQLSIVFAVLMGGRLLRESHFGIRILASLLIFAGAFLIAAAG